MKINEEGIAFIVEEETGGREYYEKVYKNTFIWPKGASGCTAMVGVDIGYYSKTEIDLFFGPLTNKEELARIQLGRGLKGAAANTYLKNLKDITFTWEEALETFRLHILPKFLKLTENAFPGVSQLCDGAKTALTSLVFNRGTAMQGDSRKEMFNLKKLVQQKDYEQIAFNIRSMKRLWDKTSGLVGRREREAKLIENCG